MTAIDASWDRTGIAAIACVILHVWISRDLRVTERDPHSWFWSPAQARALFVFLILSAASAIPYFIVHGSTVLAEAPSNFIASQLFATLIGVSAYFIYLLNPTAEDEDVPHRVEALKLEHQSCMMAFQSIATVIAVLFLGVVLSPALATNIGKGPNLLWGFYCFFGAIGWLLRPCLARAKFVRYQIEQVHARADNKSLPI